MAAAAGCRSCATALSIAPASKVVCAQCAYAYCDRCARETAPVSQNGRRTLQTVCASCHVVITVLELDEETMSDSLPLVMLRYVVKALDVDVRGCLSKRDLAHCVSKTRLEDTVGRFRAQFLSEPRNHFLAFQQAHEARRQQQADSAAQSAKRPPAKAAAHPSAHAGTASPHRAAGAAAGSAEGTSTPPPSSATPYRPPPEDRPNVSFGAIASGGSAVKALSLKEIRAILDFHNVVVPKAIERVDFEEALRRLAWELENKKDDFLCKVCFTNAINCVFTGCGHQSVCIDCAGELRGHDCPLCRQPRGAAIRFYRA